MKKLIDKMVGIGLLGATVGGSLGQGAASGVAVNEEVQITTKPGRKPFIAQVHRGPEVRAFAFSGQTLGGDLARQPIIVQGETYDAKAAEELREDMAVMARILEKTCAEHGGESERAMGLDILTFSGRGARNLYLDDYGAIFTLNVDQPLKRSNSADSTEAKPEKQVDREWEAARRELFGGNQTGATLFLEHGESKRYDAAAVERLRGNLVDALKNAGNIRNLKADHWVMFVVRGAATAPNRWYSESDPAATRGDDSTTMVIKARKSDIDAYGTGSLSEGAFRKRVMVTVY